MEKMSFSQYLDSKEKLREAVENTPVQITEHTVYKYCKFSVGEQENKEQISLKPKHKVLVEWVYNDIDNPDVSSIRFKDVEGIDSEQEFDTFWSNYRLQKWLNTNTREWDYVTTK